MKTAKRKNKRNQNDIKTKNKWTLREKVKKYEIKGHANQYRVNKS